jgi:hypothetical protein
MNTIIITALPPVLGNGPAAQSSRLRRNRHGNQTVRRIRAASLALGLAFAAAQWTTAAEIVVQGGRVNGQHRPTVVIKTANTDKTTAGATKVGVATTFDLGLDHLGMVDDTITALGLTEGNVTAINFGGTFNFNGDTVTEDAVVTFNQLNLNAGKTKLASALDASPKLSQRRDLLPWGSIR